MIPIEKESPELFKERKCYERCTFCVIDTNMWHIKTNNPVCKKCAKIHKVSELVNHLKPNRK